MHETWRASTPGVQRHLLREQQLEEAMTPCNGLVELGAWDAMAGEAEKSDIDARPAQHPSDAMTCGRVVTMDERRDGDDRNTLERITFDVEAIIAAKVADVEILAEIEFSVLMISIVSFPLDHTRYP